MNSKQISKNNSFEYIIEEQVVAQNSYDPTKEGTHGTDALL